MGGSHPPLLACSCLRLVGLLVSYLRLVPWLMAIKNLRAGFPPTCELAPVTCGLCLGDEPSCTGSQLSLSPLIARLLDSDRLIMLMFTVSYIWNSTVPTRPAVLAFVILLSRRACFF